MKLLHLNLFLIDIHLNMEILHTLQMYLLQFIMNQYLVNKLQL